MTKVKPIKSSHLDFPQVPDGNFSALHQVVDRATPSGFAGGLVVFKDASIDFTTWYDEILFCFRKEGKRFAIRVEEETFELEEGDSLWLPAGTVLTYISEGKTQLFYAVTPSDWRDRRP